MTTPPCRSPLRRELRGGCAGRVDLHRVHLEDAVGIEAVEHDPFAIGGPIRCSVVDVVVGELDDSGTVGVHHVDLETTVAVRCEHQPRAIGRPVRVAVEVVVVGELERSAAVWIEHEDLRIAVSIRLQNDRSGRGVGTTARRRCRDDGRSPHQRSQRGHRPPN